MLADLARVRVWPRPDEVAAVVLQVCGQVTLRGSAAGGVAPAVTPAALRIGADGSVLITGGAPAVDEQTVSLLGHLLLDLVGSPDRSPGSATPPELRALGIAAAARPSPFRTVADFAEELGRHAPADGRATVRALWERGASRQFPRHIEDGDATPDLTVPAAGAGPRDGRRLVVRTALVGAAVLLLSGAGAALWLADTRTPLPPAPPLSTPVLPRPLGHPGWELLGRPGGLPVRVVVTALAPPAARPPEPEGRAHVDGPRRTAESAGREP